MKSGKKYVVLCRIINYKCFMRHKEEKKIKIFWKIYELYKKLRKNDY